jgi:nucleoside-diphosphate-sugar epimerase
MTRVVIIGGSGHVGSYLVPRLVQAGYEVINVSRGEHKPYHPDAAWSKVQHVALNRWEEEKVLPFRGASGQSAAPDFAIKVAALKPDILIDMLCFSLSSCQRLAEQLLGQVRHYLFCGTCWMLGPAQVVPTPEDYPRRPFLEYGIQKVACENYLLDLAQKGRLPATLVCPGSITGPGYMPVTPLGNYDPQVFEVLARGEELLMPSLGMETLHHVHADDVAQLFLLSVLNWSASVGQSFWAVSPAAITMRGYATAAAGWWGQEPKMRTVPFDEWKTTTNERHAETTWNHLLHSTNCSIAKARRMLGYQPRYSSLEALRECVESLVEAGTVQAPKLGAQP